MRALMRPRAPKRWPKDAQERTGDAKSLPKGARRVQDRPWRPQKASKHRCGPRRVLGTIVADSLVRKAAKAVFGVFSCCAHCLRHVFRPNEIVVLSHSERSDNARTHARKDLEKQAPGGSKTDSKPSKIEAGTSPDAPKPANKRQQTQQEAQSAPQKRPRAKNSANMVLKRPNKV